MWNVGSSAMPQTIREFPYLRRSPRAAMVSEVFLVVGVIDLVLFSMA
jgi:hypothetical protein